MTEKTSGSGVGQRVSLSGERERLFVASQWQLMWWRFRKHKVALISAVILILFYVVAIFCEFFAPCDPYQHDPKRVLAPPQTLHFRDEEGFRLRPYVYPLEEKRNEETLALEFQPDRTQKLPLHFFVHGAPYKLWGLWEMDLHFIGVKRDKPASANRCVYLLGADDMGRDLLSRIVYGARISLSLGFVGVMLSLFLGILLGGISGYFGGAVDIIIQRVVEYLRSIPGIPLWMSLAAAMPEDWGPLRIYFGITVILSFLGWTGLARVVRGKFLSLREEDFVLAAKLIGASELRIILIHMVPSFMSYLIASLTITIPNMILSETALSFLGVGLQSPVISWGVLLQKAQNVRALVQAPWLFLPGLAVVIVVLAFNFVGDGLRDAADPYAR
jgi:peptide/nickel transport system permease protein